MTEAGHALHRQAVAATLLFLLLGSTGCAAGGAVPGAAGEGEETRTVFVNSLGWHTGFIVRVQDIPAALWPQSRDFVDNRFIRVGWGDRDFYQSRDFNLGYALKAILWPTDSVLHVVGFDAPVESFFAHSEIIAIALSLPGFERLCTYISRTYADGEDGQPVVLGPGHYANSRFYLSRGRYHAFNTSNAWTARGLAAAGVPISPRCAFTRESVMSQLREHGQVIQPWKARVDPKSRLQRVHASSPAAAAPVRVRTGQDTLWRCAAK